MFVIIVPVTILWALSNAEDYYYIAPNVSRSSLSGIEAYRSALTLDWMAAEDQRQRELVAAFETEASPPPRVITTECINYARPASGKVARLMLELLKNLEGDDGTLVTDLIHSLIRAKLLVETSMLDSEPDLEALVKTPAVMMGEPHVTFPRILAMLWMSVTDPVLTKKSGWCSVKKVSQYLTVTRPMHIAKHMRALDPVLARARFVMDEFIQHVTPLSVFQKPTKALTVSLPRERASQRYNRYQTVIVPTRSTTRTIRPAQLDLAQSGSSPPSELSMNEGSPEVLIQAGSPALPVCRVLLMCVSVWCML